MGNLDRSGIRRAAKLLAKAASTDSDDEAIALTLRSYSLLADAINAYDLAVPGPVVMNGVGSGTGGREFVAPPNLQGKSRTPIRTRP